MVDERGAPRDGVPGEVYQRRYDPISGQYLPEVTRLGSTSVESMKIAPGFYRFVIEYDSGFRTEHFRHLPDEPRIPTQVRE